MKFYTHKITSFPFSRSLMEPLCDEISVVSFDGSEELDFIPLTKKHKCECYSSKSGTELAELEVLAC